MPRLSHTAAELSLKLGQQSTLLSNDPSEDPEFQVKLYPITIERSARLNIALLNCEAALFRADQAYEDETSRLDEEWSNGKARVRARLLEGIEERRRRAREEKDNNDLLMNGMNEPFCLKNDCLYAVDFALDAQARAHITRKTRNQMAAAGISPPQEMSPLPTMQHNNHSLRIEDIVSPFPLALSSMQLPTQPPVAAVGTGRRKGKGITQAQALAAKGAPSYSHLTEAKESEKDMDLGDIRRASKRKRGAVHNTVRA